MKLNRILLSVVTLCFINCLVWGNEVLSESRSFVCKSNSNRSLDISFSLPEYQLEVVRANDTAYTKFTVQDAGYFVDSGSPELPYLTTMIAIPPKGNFTIEMIQSQEKILTDILPYPAQNGEYRQTPQPFERNALSYEQGRLFPAELFKCSQPMILRDLRVITLQIQPFTWDSATRQMQITTDIRLRINFNDELGDNELPAPICISPIWVNLYESMIVNFADYRTAVVANTPPRILVVHGNYADAAYMEKLNAFAFWKRQKGADVQLVSTAITGNTNTAIKSYLQGQYDNVATRPDFIVLVGDVSGAFPVPAWIEGLSGYNGGGDYTYQLLSGEDALGDCFLGRISAENVAELDVILTKSLAYEKYINVSTAGWINRILLVGDTLPSGQSTVYTNKYIKELAQLFNPDYTFAEFYSGDPLPSSVDAVLNTGVGLFNYRGIYGMSGWSPTENLVNGNKLPHAVIITCSTGDYWNGTATSEAFIRLGTPAVPKGAVSAVGMSTSETHTMYNNCLSGGIFSGLFSHHMHTMGEALLNGKLYLHQTYGVTHAIQSRYFAHWCNLMGDPSMEVFTNIPQTFTTNAPGSIPAGCTALDLQVRDQNNLPVENACVTLALNGMIIARAYTNAQGIAYLSITAGIESGTAELTVSSHDFKPLQQEILVNSGGSLILNSVSYNDDNQGGSSGNGDQNPNSGEFAEVFFSLHNSTNLALHNINGVLSVDDPYIVIFDSLLTFDDIPAASNGTNALPALVLIASDCPNNTTHSLSLLLTDGSAQSYSITIHILVTDANLGVVSHQIIDSNNNALEALETVELNITLVNSGSVGIENVTGELYTMNDLVAIEDDAGSWGNLSVAGQAANTTDNFVLRGRAGLLPGMNIPMRLQLTNPDGYSQWVEFSLPIGIVNVNSPLGPDAYGYVIYDDGDVSYPECPVYQWVGIAPAEGGTGSALAINDPDADGEGDGVGAGSLAYVTLPFGFRFYGVEYNQISVCSNGFIVMGFSANGEFRNYRLPGAMGPSPMIAAFWDDLATGTGSGVYTWYDTINHRYIIEWYHMRNGYQPSCLETFQVLLYDQDFYSTSLGDGPIKIQYMTFNNVDSGTSNENHGNYCSIGIENANQQVGLEYTYNNQYPAAARILGHGRAIYISNVPTYAAQPELSINEGIDINTTNNDDVIEPSETVQLSIPLHNSGDGIATNTVATLSSTSQYVTMVSATSAYPHIMTGQTETNLIPFVFEVSETCPANEVISFVMNVQSDSNPAEISFNLTVRRPSLNLVSYYLNDMEGNNNGIADSNEEFLLILNVTNLSQSQALNVVGTLDSSLPNVTISDHVQVRPIVSTNSAMQFVFPIHFGALPIYTVVPFEFAYTADNAEAGMFTMEMPCGTGTPNRTGKVSGSVTMSDLANPSVVMVSADSQVFTTPDPAGSYDLYLPLGVYQLSATLEHYYYSGESDVTLSETSPIHVTDIVMNFLANPGVLNVHGTLHHSTCTLSWSAPTNPLYPVQNYDIYRKRNGELYSLIAVQSALNYVDILDQIGTYSYYVTAVYNVGEGAHSNEVTLQYPFVGNEDESVIPMDGLYANFPNPFNPTTTISYSLSKASQVNLKIYNSKGQLIQTLKNEHQTAGFHKATWKALDANQKAVSSGIYLIRMETDRFQTSRKMILLK